MKISLNFVKQFTDVDVSTEELVKLATERLGGIEGVTDYGKHFDGIVIAKIVSCIKHPNADKLSLCKVDDGGVVKDVVRDENGYVQVVCGAPNVREGLLVAWIPPGATVPASYGEKELFVLEARDLRGEVSNGMLASPAELGMSDDHKGILEISDDQLTKDDALAISDERLSNNHSKSSIVHASQMANGSSNIEIKPGTPFKNLYDLDDTIIEIENKMFTHRPDGFGHLGVAREIAGIQHKAFHSPNWYLNPQLPSGKSNVTVKIEDGELSQRYMAVEFENVAVKPSPLWLQSYLKRVGIRPINNIVDITNYIMILTAQPVHAFDFDKIATLSGHSERSDNVAEESRSFDSAQDDKHVEISVRRPKEGEKMTLLDGKVIAPHKDATLICNPNGPIALGGVMGGGNSEIDENTTHVVLECATFNMYNIRKTSMIHGLFTEAATRLTKGQPAAQLPSVLAKAIGLFEELAEAKVVGGPVDAIPSTNDQRPMTNNYIEIETKFINDRLGSKFTTEEIINLLTNVEFAAHEASGPISVTPPFWRTDIEIPEDIVEEVGRLYGFNQLPLSLPQRSIAPVTSNPLRNLKSELRSMLSRAGANEVLTYSFVHGNLLRKAGQNFEHCYALRNALSPDLQYYRLSLTPNLLDLVHSNIRAGFSPLALFELGKTHFKGEMDAAEPQVPNEDNHLAFVLAYDKKTQPAGAAYYAVKNYLAQLAPELINELVPMKDFDVSGDEWGQQLVAPYDPERSALVIRDNQIWGVIGEFRAEVSRQFKLPDFTAGFELHLDVLQSESTAHRPLSKYPSTEQDITLKVGNDMPYSKLADCLKQTLETSDYQYALEPLGIYQKEAETKNVTIRLTLSHYERTLTTSEVNQLVEQLTWQAHEQLGATQV